MTPPSDPRRRGDAGFTLLEVLMAMVILSVGLLAIEGMAVGAAKTSASAARRSRYTEVATDTLERTLSRLREGQGASSGSYTLRDNSGASAATVTITVTDGGALASPSPSNRRWDVQVRVMPTSSSRLADSVNLVASVIQ